jgi:hypothetical protein
VKGGITSSEDKNKIKGKDTGSDDEKKDENKDQAGKKGDSDNKSKSDDAAKDGNNGGWTEEQDKQIKDMKAVNSSWREIAAAVGASKKDVQHRFKELSKETPENEEEQSLGLDDFSGLFEESDGGSAKDEGGKSGGGKKGGKEKGCGAKNCCHGKGCGEGDGKKNQNQNQKGGNNGNGKKGRQGGWDTSSGGGSGWNEKNNWSNSNSNGNGNGGGEKMWYDDPEVTGVQPDDNNNNSNQSNQNQNNGNGNQNEGEKRSGYGRLRPDDIWSREDLEVLEFLEAKYEENKWMYMQAGFYNWGGRMVDASMIEKKFRDDGAV